MFNIKTAPKIQSTVSINKDHVDCSLHIPRFQRMDLVSSTFLASFLPLALEASFWQQLMQLSWGLGLALVLVDLQLVALELALASERVESLLGEGSWVLASLAYNPHGQLILSKGMHRLLHQNQHEQSVVDITIQQHITTTYNAM